MSTQTDSNPRAGQSAGAETNIRNTSSIQQTTVNPRPLPHDLDPERAILACVLYGNVIPSTLDLTGDDFYSPDHEALWTVLEAMEQAGENIDPLVASARLNAAVERLADPALVPSLAGGSEIPGNAGTYAGMVHEASRRRHALAFIRQAGQRLAQGDDPADVLDEGQLDGLRTGARRTGSRLGKLIDPAQVKAVRREWVKKDWYPCDVVTILAGHGGEGKSTFSLADVAAGSRGELHGRRWQQPVRSIIVATEDTQSDQKLRLRAAGAVFEHIRFFTVTDPRGKDLHFNLESDLDELRAASQHFSADLLVIDPLSSVTSGLDLNKAADMRKALDPLTMLARQLHVAILVIHHFNKGLGNASRKMTGSEAIRDIARSVIHFAHDKESDERVLTFDKGNYSTYEGRSFDYELKSGPAINDAGNQMIDEEGNLESVPVARLIGETDNSVEKIINTQPQGQDGEDRNEAQKFLIDYLSDAGGQAQAGDVLKAGRAAGFDDKQLKNARARSKSPRIRPQKVGVPKGYWVWSLEDEELKDSRRTHEGLRPQEVSSSSPSVSPSQKTEAVTDPHRDHIGTIGTGSQEASPMDTMASPMGDAEIPGPPESSKPQLALVPNSTCSHCGRKYRPGPKCNYCGTPTGEVAS